MVNKFITELQNEIEHHEAVHHPFLRKFAALPLSVEQIQTFGLQHYQLVKIFVNYMAILQPRIPDPSTSALFRRVYEDEFGQHTIFRSHPALYRNFLKKLGLQDNDWGRVAPLPETARFVETHMEMTRDDDFRIGLGAIGPGHEFSIPIMFSYLVKGIESNTRLEAEDYEYFTFHMVQDKVHAEIFNELISHFNTPDDHKRIREGALRSLEARRDFWGGLEKAVFGDVVQKSQNRSFKGVL